MSVDTCILDNILYVRWVEPELGDHDALSRMVHAHCTVHGPLVAVVTILPPKLRIPPQSFTEAAVASMRRYGDLVGRWFLVVEAEGIRYTVLRCTGVLMTILAGLRGRAAVVKSVEHALRELTGALTRDPKSILRDLQRAGLLLNSAL
ncbi:MAG TPA: hypothetical protein VFH51_11180 [Myxococcota bacterium]|nr:hypothetical protein [Myxococcota bacterium]